MIQKMANNKYYRFGKYKNLTYKEAKEKERKYIICVNQLRKGEKLVSF